MKISDNIFSVTIFEVADKVFKVSIGVVTTFFVAAALGPEIYSSIAVGLAVMSIISMWINSAIRVPFFQNIDFALFSFILTFLFLASLIAMAIVIFRVSNDLLIENVLLIFIVASFFKFHNILRLDYEKNLKQKFFIVYENLILFIFLIIKIILTIYYKDIKLIALAYLFESICVILFFLFILKNKLKVDRSSIKKFIANSKEILNSNKFIIVGGFVAVSYMAIDTVILDAVASSQEIGNWGIAKRINQLVITLLVVSSNVFIASYLNNKESIFLSSSNLRFIATIFLIAISLTLSWMLFGSHLTVFILGSDYYVSYEYLRILCISWPAIAINAFIVQYILVRNFQSVIFTTNVLLFLSVCFFTTEIYEIGGMNLVSIFMTSLMIISPFLLLSIFFTLKKIKT